MRNLLSATRVHFIFCKQLSPHPFQRSIRLRLLLIDSSVVVYLALCYRSSADLTTTATPKASVRGNLIRGRLKGAKYGKERG